MISGVYFVFDAHYAPSRHYVQVLRKHPHTVQNVGPQCPRSDVNGGEDNAVYNAFYFSCIRCKGADEYSPGMQAIRIGKFGHI